MGETSENVDGQRSKSTFLSSRGAKVGIFSEKWVGPSANIGQNMWCDKALWLFVEVTYFPKQWLAKPQLRQNNSHVIQQKIQDTVFQYAFFFTLVRQSCISKRNVDSSLKMSIFYSKSQFRRSLHQASLRCLEIRAKTNWGRYNVNHWCAVDFVDEKPSRRAVV